MRILIVENYHHSPLGQVGVALDEAAAEQVIVRAWDGDPLPPAPDDFDGMVVLGGEQNALDDALYPYFADLLELIRQFERQNKAVLGICLGSQLIARAFGGDNILGIAKEFGWHQVEITEAGRQDPLFAETVACFSIFEWHSDTFTLPPVATRLATNGTVENQCYRIGRACYGTQFHFEANTTVVDGWNTSFADVINRIDPDWTHTYEDRRLKHGAAADAAGLAIARQWVSLASAGSGAKPQ